MPENWHEGTLEQLFNNLQSNLDQHVQVREKFIGKYQRNSVAEFKSKDLRLCISQAVIKWLIDRAHNYGHSLENIKCCQYEKSPQLQTRSPYYIYKYALVFSKGTILSAIIPTKGIPLQGWMVDDLVKSIERHNCKDIDDELLTIMERKPDIVEILEQEIKDLRNLMV